MKIESVGGVCLSEEDIERIEDTLDRLDHIITLIAQMTIPLEAIRFGYLHGMTVTVRNIVRPATRKEKT